MDGQHGSLGLHTFPAARFDEGCILGEGKNGTVWLAFDFELDRSVALKVSRADTIVDELELDDEKLDQAMRGVVSEIEHEGVKSGYTLVREARLTAQVHHPGVITVLEVGILEDNDQDSRVVVVMPILPGERLPPTAPWRSILDRILQLARGLAALHEVGIVHRDLKPDNILYDDDGWPCIADLGLACKLSDEAAMNHFVGSSKWMAPEVLAGESRSGAQNDIFGFSMIVFEMLYGHSPFVDEAAKRDGRISDIKRSDDMPASLHCVVVKGLAPDPAKRWTSMPDVIAALEGVRQGEPRRRPPKRRWLGAVAAAGLSVGLGVGMYVTLPEAKADACDEVSRELVDFWNADVQTELRVVLGSRKASDYLESFASRWVNVRASECEAAKREGRPERASPCTASVRSHLNATVGALRTPHERQGLDFEEVLGGLPAPEYCLEHPEDAEYGAGGLLELRQLGVEIMAELASGNLDVAARRQADFMAAARESSSSYDIARAIYWRAELHQLRGELDEAEADFKRAYSEAMELGATDLEGDAMMMLASVAGAKGELAALEERAFVAGTVFGRRRPDKVAQLLQVQGLALAEGDPTQRDRGIALLRDAVAMREAQHSHYGGSREKVGWALEGLARGLLAGEQADEAVTFAKQSLAVHELEFGGFTNRAHELRRLLFVAEVNASLLDNAAQTLGLLRDGFYQRKEYIPYLEETLWAADVYIAAGRHEYATKQLVSVRQVAASHGLTDIERRAEDLFREVAGEP